MAISRDEIWPASGILPKPVAPLAPIQLKPPRLALLATPVPERGVLCSALFHAGLLAFLAWFPLLFPDQPKIVLRSAADIIRESTYEPIPMPDLPSILRSGSGSNGGGTAGPGHAGARHAARAASAPTERPKMIYPGAQEIVSNPPDASNVVQTIRRPDMVTPPKLKYPVRLRSMVMLPAPAVPALIAPPSPRAEPVSDSPKVEVAAVVDHPALPVRIPKRLKQVAQEAPNAPILSGQGMPVLDPAHQALPVLSPDALTTGPQAVVVLNAVNVPADKNVAVPDAEISGSFAVTASPSRAAAAGAGGSGSLEGRGGTADSGSGSGDGRVAGTGSGKGNGTGAGSGSGTAAAGTGSGGAGHGNGSGSGVGPGTGSGTGVGPGNAGNGHATGAGPGNGTGSSAGAGKGAAPGSGIPGISIIGGSSGRSSRGGGIRAPVSRGSYGMTIMAAGTSGGAIRDLGVFSRSETVYTVYIPMADAGGGPDWPMQYALAGPAVAGDGLLTPPFGLLKVPAVGGADIPANNQVFIVGTVDEEGRIRDLHSARGADALSQIAISALTHWRFQPALIKGKAVAAKVLIGVTVGRSAAAVGAQ